MSVCPSCHAATSVDDVFCMSCGTRLTVDARSAWVPDDAASDLTPAAGAPSPPEVHDDDPTTVHARFDDDDQATVHARFDGEATVAPAYSIGDTAAPGAPAASITPPPTVPPLAPEGPPGASSVPAPAGAKRARLLLVGGVVAAIVVAGLAVVVLRGGSDGGGSRGPSLTDDLGRKRLDAIGAAPESKGSVAVGDDTSGSQRQVLIETGTDLVYAVLVTAGDASVTAVKVSDGTKAWKQSLKGYDTGGVNTELAPDGLVVSYSTGGGQGRIVRFDRSGNSTAPIDTDSVLSAVNRGAVTLFVAQVGRSSQDVDVVDFSKRKVGRSVTVSQFPLFVGANAIVVRDDDRASILDAKTLVRKGKAVTLNTGENVVGSVAGVFLTANDKTIRALDAAGKEKWTYRHKLGVVSQVVDAGGGRLFAYGSDGSALLRVKGSDAEDVGELSKGPLADAARIDGKLVIGVSKATGTLYYDASTAPAKELGTVKVQDSGSGRGRSLGLAPGMVFTETVTGTDSAKLRAVKYSGDEVWSVPVPATAAVYAGPGYFVVVQDGSVKVYR